VSVEDGFSEQCQGVVAIDGKVLRRSFDCAGGKSVLHMVSAWGYEQRMVLALIATEAKSKIMPALLEMLSLQGTIVITDALNCQRVIVEEIVDQGSHYALALKANQATLHGDVRTYLDDPAGKVTTPRRPIMAASKPARRRSRPISTGCGTTTNGSA